MSPDNVETISIYGAGKGEFGGGTVVRLTSPIPEAVIYYPYLSTTRGPGFWSNLHLQGFTVDANALAPSCFDLEAIRVAHLEDLSCTAATGKEAWVRVGALPATYGGKVPDGYNGSAFQVMASDLFVYHNGVAPEAEIKAHISNGSVQGYEIRKPGRFREAGELAVFIKRPYGGDAPCKSMPQGLTGHVVPDREHREFHELGSISQQDGGDHCSDDLTVIAVDMPAAKYGFEIFATDSSFYDLTDDSVGREAGISDRGSGRTLFVHAHVWNTWGGLELWGGESVVTPELDSEYGYGIRFRWGKGTAVLNPTFVYIQHPAYADMVEYLFDPDATDMTIAEEGCGIVDPNRGHVQFAWVDQRTNLGYGTLAGADTHATHPLALPHGLHSSGLGLCSDQQPPGVIKLTSESISDAGSERRIFWSGANAGKDPVSFLVAELPSGRQPPALPALRITVVGSGGPGEVTEQVFHIANTGAGILNVNCSQEAKKPGPVTVSTYTDDKRLTKIYLTVRSSVNISVLIDMVNDPEIHLENSPVSRVPDASQFCR